MSPAYVPALGGVVVVATIGLAAVKLLGVDMSWWWVAAPFLTVAGLSTLVGFVFVFAALLGDKR